MVDERLAKEGLLQRLISPRRLIEAGVIVCSFALPALMVLGGDVETPRTVIQELLAIGSLGLGLAIPSVVIADVILKPWEINKKLEAMAGTLEKDTGVLDAGVPMMGVEEIHE